VRREPSLSKAWKDSASIQPETIFEAVCRDLHARFSFGHQKKLLHDVNLRVQRLSPGENVRAAVEDFCVQVITSQAQPLPVPYYEVLDRLGLIGKSQARAALLVAYSISASTRLTGEAFLLRVEETWKVASS
jgi:hypothetical protein